jgi:hypothetical protein
VVATPIQRVVLVFVLHDPGGPVLLVRRPASASVYAGRWSTVAGDVEGGDPLASARGALAAELPAARVELGAEGLAVDFSDTVRRRQLSFRVHPFLARFTGGALPDGAVWVEPDELILRGALGETVPELDEALARVLDPPAALPPPFRDEARLLHTLEAPSRALARRAVAIVAGGAPPERVAALRPALARVVNAARAAGRPSRDVAHELELAARAEQRAVLSAIEGAGTVAALGAVPVEPTAPPATAALLVIGVEAVLPRGDVVAPAGAAAAARAALARGARVLACADAWAGWADDIPPPLPPELELLPRGLLTRVIGSAN